MRKLSSLAVLFVLAAALCAGTAAFAFDGNHLMKFKATNECSKCDLKQAHLPPTDSSHANLEEANLYKAMLNGANLYGAGLYEANLEGANLKRIILLQRLAFHRTTG
jgi:uncharacterized protein YjbI with pentapeptide repeats